MGAKSALTAAEFRKLWISAQLIDKNDPLIKNWNYSPWCDGRFQSGDKVYDFDVYLGGLGLLQLPTGQSGYFLLDLKSLGRKLE